MRWWIVDRIFRHEKLELRVRVTRCHESSSIFYGRSNLRDICAEQLVSEKRDIPLFQNIHIAVGKSKNYDNLPSSYSI